jgi:hypothetical protein
MHKFILIAAFVLASASVQAGPMRSLTLASNDQPAAAEQPKAVEQKTVEQKPVETPKAVEAPAANEAPNYVARPAAVGTATAAPNAEPAGPVARKTTTSRVEKPKRRRESTEARVIRELNRHGIYW